MSRLTAPDRLRRLLAIVPWVASVGGASLDEIAERFDYPRDRLERDLFEVVQFVGVYPYTPDELIEVFIDPDSGRVTINYADYFRQPLQLTPDQALALVGAGASLTNPKEHETPLMTGIAKLADKLGVAVGETVEIQLGAADPELLAVAREAVDTNHQLEIDYYSHGRDKRSLRLIDPQRLFAQAGAWYLSAYCHTAEDNRVFRLDRVHAATLQDSRFEPADEAASTLVFDPDPDDPRVTIELDASAAWVADYYPTESVEPLDGGGVRVVLAITAQTWLERLLLQLGPHARVIHDASSLDSGARAEAARRVLARYQR